MAEVTYHGPRPEIVPAFAMPHGMIDEDLRWIGAMRKNGTPKMVAHEAPVLERGRPTEVSGLFALGLAMIRRRPSPWFTVHFHTGEYAEIACRLPRSRSCDCFDEGKPADDECPACHGHGSVLVADYQHAVLFSLHWRRGSIEEFYRSESKVLFVNGDVVYAPPGWASQP